MHGYYVTLTFLFFPLLLSTCQCIHETLFANNHSLTATCVSITLSGKKKLHCACIAHFHINLKKGQLATNNFFQVYICTSESCWLICSHIKFNGKTPDRYNEVCWQWESEGHGVLHASVFFFWQSTPQLICVQRWTRGTLGRCVGSGWEGCSVSMPTCSNICLCTEMHRQINFKMTDRGIYMQRHTQR